MTRRNYDHSVHLDATETETIVAPVPTISDASGLGYFSIHWKDFGGGMSVTFLSGLGASNAVLSLGGWDGEADFYGRKRINMDSAVVSTHQLCHASQQSHASKSCGPFFSTERRLWKWA